MFAYVRLPRVQANPAEQVSLFYNKPGQLR